MFDRSWFLILRIRGDDIDQYFRDKGMPNDSPLTTMKMIRKSISERKSGQISREVMIVDTLGVRIALKYSSAKIASANKNRKEYVISTVTPNLTAEETLSYRDASNLASVLAKVDPEKSVSSNAVV